MLSAACSSGGRLQADAATQPTGTTGTSQHSTTDGAVYDGPAQARDVNWPEVPPDEPAGIFVAVGYGGRRVRSIDDGRTWTDDASLEVDAGNDDTFLRTAVWANQRFMAFGYREMASPDGKEWQDFGIDAINQWLGAVVYAQGQFVGVGGYGLRGTSPDGLIWQLHDVDLVGTYAPDGLVYDPSGSGHFVDANFNGQRSSSPDGVTWTYATGAEATPTTDLAAGNGVVVGVGAAGVVLSSDGGATWTDVGALAAQAHALIFAQGRFTVIAAQHVATSTDGRSWSDHPVAGVDGTAIGFGNGTYVLVSAAGIRRSPDALQWEAPLASPNPNGLVRVTFGIPGEMVDAGGAGHFVDAGGGAGARVAPDTGVAPDAFSALDSGID